MLRISPHFQRFTVILTRPNPTYGKPFLYFSHRRKDELLHFYQYDEKEKLTKHVTNPGLTRADGGDTDSSRVGPEHVASEETSWACLRFDQCTSKIFNYTPFFTYTPNKTTKTNATEKFELDL